MFPDTLVGTPNTATWVTKFYDTNNSSIVIGNKHHNLWTNSGASTDNNWVNDTSGGLFYGYNAPQYNFTIPNYSPDRVVGGGFTITDPSYVTSGAPIIPQEIHVVSNGDNCTSWYINWFNDKKSLFRDKIRMQLLPSVVNKRCGIEVRDGAELRARALLREMISPREYFKYLKTGFLTVFGRSGMVYRVSGLYKKIRCYVRNNSGKYEAFEDLCIVFNGEFNNLPYTDWVIMRKVLIENDEFGMRKVAISSKVYDEPQLARVG